MSNEEIGDIIPRDIVQLIVNLVLNKMQKTYKENQK